MVWPDRPAHRFSDDYKCKEFNKLDKYAPNFCRIEMQDGSHMGTGWLVAEGLTKKRGLIVTNRHVAREFQKSTDLPPKHQAFANFRANPEPGQAYADRLQMKLEYMDNYADVAVYSIANPPDKKQGLEFSNSAPEPDTSCWVIGYPGQDASDAAKALFGTVFGVLRLSPGLLVCVCVLVCIGVCACVCVGVLCGRVGGESVLV